MTKTLVGALALALAIAPAAAFADKGGVGQGRDHRNPFASIPVSGTSSAGAFTGTMDIVGWTTGTDAAGNPTTNAIGILNGTLAGMPVTNQLVTWPLLAQDPAGCQVLDLVLGPLNLNLLGLVVTLNQVHLNITAVPGAGNLLGNLLCAITNLLNGGALGGVLTTLLNNLTTVLAGLGL